MELEAIRLWPYDPVARQAYLTTYAQLGIERAEHELPQAGAGILRRALAQRVSLLAEGSSEREADAFAAVLAGEVARGIERARATVKAGIEHAY